MLWDPKEPAGAQKEPNEYSPESLTPSLKIRKDGERGQNNALLDVAQTDRSPKTADAKTKARERTGRLEAMALWSRWQRLPFLIIISVWT